MTPWSQLISSEEILDLHSKAIAAHAQPPIGTGPSTVDCIDGCLGNAWTSEAYCATEDDGKPGLCFAGYLLFYLIRDHCFQDGNKRVGWTASMAVLANLGLTVKATTEEAEAFVLKVVSSEIRNGLEVVRWLASRLEAPELN